MTVHSAKITPDGRLQIPAQIRREMGIQAGETFNLEVQDGILSVRRPAKTLERVRAKLAPYLAPDSDLLGDLKAMRVEDAGRD